MGTNYYFANKQSIKEVSQFNEELEHILAVQGEELIKIGCNEEVVERELNNLLWSCEKYVEEIHIGKRSAGWKPLFQIQEYYHGITGMKEWYERNRNEWDITNEYGENFTWDELEKELINWNKDDELAISHEFDFGNDYEIIDNREWTSREFS